MSQTNTSYPLPTLPLPVVPSVNPRTPHEICGLIHAPKPPPGPTPTLPCARRRTQFTATHTLSTHILPAARARRPTPPGEIAQVPSHLSSRSERAAWAREACAALVQEKRVVERIRTGRVIPKVGLWSVVNRYARVSIAEDGRRGLTLVAAHPVGFSKEMWEPMFKQLIEITESYESSVRIDEIWSLDMASHGDAGLLNAGNLPMISDRGDYGLDIANFCVYYMPHHREYDGTPLPVHLPQVEQRLANERMRNGYKDRTIVGLGHSLSADAQIVLALAYPEIFSALILSEPTIFPQTTNSFSRSIFLGSTTLQRRSSWKSRQEARESFSKSPMFQAFHPDMLDAYISHCLFDDPKNGVVRLKCDPRFEAVELLENRVNNEGWELLPTLDERIELKWIMGADESAGVWVGGVDVIQRTVWRRQNNSSNVKIPGGGHLVVQEKPFEHAAEVAKFLIGKYAVNEDVTEKARL